MNLNYKEINAKTETEDPESVFHYYRKLIALRKEHPVIVYGNYELLLADSEELFVYTRTLEEKKLLVVCNFTDSEVPFSIPEAFVGADCLIANRVERGGEAESRYDEAETVLGPYEAFVLMTV